MLNKKSLKNVKKYIQKYTALREVFINLLLVISGGRKTTLIETANFANEMEIQYGLNVIYKFAKFLKSLGYKLVVTTDKMAHPDYPRYFVSDEKITPPNSHLQIGKILEMYCYDHLDYSDSFQDRFLVHIQAIDVEEKTLNEIYSEVCIFSKLNLDKFQEFISQKITKMTESMKSLGLNFEFVAEFKDVPSIPTLEKHLKDGDLVWIKNNWDEYLNFFENFGSENDNQQIQNIKPTKKNLNSIYKIFKGIDFSN